MFSSTERVIETDSGKRVVELTIRLLIKDATGTVRVTDIMLQSGSISTLWDGHPSETKWTVDG
jgi:hypothetical protein